jgi:hypothetical protein
MVLFRDHQYYVYQATKEMQKREKKSVCVDRLFSYIVLRGQTPLSSFCSCMQQMKHNPIDKLGFSLFHALLQPASRAVTQSR